MSANVQSVIKLTPSIRKKASANIWQRKEEAFDMNELHESIKSTLSKTNKQQTIFEALKQIDLTRIVKESPGLNQFFTCSFFVKRYAWISKNENGEYRYFSKIKDGYGFYALDLFDLLGIVLNLTTTKTIEYLKETYQVTGMSSWEEEENEKYTKNIRMIQSLSIEKTPSLKRLLQTGIDVLTSFLSYGKEKISGKHLSDGEHAVFFLSTSYFKEKFFPEKSVSTLNQWVNLFAVLGLIEKTTNVPTELQVEAEKQQVLKKKHNHISFYLIPHFSKVLEQAEVRASLLVSNRISYHQVTKKLVLSLFGQAVHDHVYVQKTHGRKRKETHLEESRESDMVFTFFNISIAEKGLAVKKELKEMSGMSATRFNQIWSEIVKEQDCEVGTPTIQERKQLGLNARQMIARRKQLLSPAINPHIWTNQSSLPWDCEEESLSLQLA
ncbi:hypothetical protein [Rossellomorea marisflavi]|uniref:hypothetical protein n=1 Tax=Rossellomorea marisflavi TaxID=189381 RepID=UPI003F9EFCAB